MASVKTRLFNVYVIAYFLNCILLYGGHEQALQMVSSIRAYSGQLSSQNLRNFDCQIQL